MEVVTGGGGRTGFDSPDDSLATVAALLHAAGFVRLRLGEFLENYELTEGRHAVLWALDRAGDAGLSQSEVAERLMQSESNISSLIDRLHRDGLVDRHLSATDRRKRVLLLTASGQQLIERVERARQRWAEALLSDLALHDRRGLTEGLKRLPGSVRGPTTQRMPPFIPRIETVHGTALWPVHPPMPVHPPIRGGDPKSPHFALEQMLLTLGVAGRGAEE